MTCNHEWEPLQGWYARYRCIVCLVVGYKQLTVTGFGSKEIVPYLCTARRNRKACGQPVVYSHTYDGERLCSEHENKRRVRAQKGKS